MKQLKIIQILAYSIIAYVIVFIIWWANLLIRTEQLLFQSQKEIIEIRQKYDSVSVVDLEIALQQSKKMIIYEAFFFLLLFIVASWYVIRLIKTQQVFSDLKRNFLLATTHEFKTPLASLTLNLQTFQQNEHLPKKAKDMLINNSINDVLRLSNLINNILLASKIDAHDYQFSRSSVNISSLLLQVIKQFHSPRIQVDVQPNCYILADETSIKIVLMNLIDNALKYSQDDIVVSLESNDEVIIKIADQGIGIPLTERKKVFQRFYRIEDERTRSTQGTGLGLFLVNSMILANNGSVEIETNEPKGSIFVIKLPNYAQAT